MNIQTRRRVYCLPRELPKSNDGRTLEIVDTMTDYHTRAGEMIRKGDSLFALWDSSGTSGEGVSDPSILGWTLERLLVRHGDRVSPGQCVAEFSREELT